MAEAEIQIDASRGSLLVKGDQAFVSETIEKYKYIFENAPKPPPPVTPDLGASSGGTAGKVDTSGALSSFSNVFDVEGDAISIIVAPPGSSMTAQAKSLILLFLYARFKLGAEPTGIDLIREQCKAHACFDAKNFTGHVKAQKNFVTVTGANSSMAARLTVPGRKAAEELAQKLQASE